MNNWKTLITFIVLITSQSACKMYYSTDNISYSVKDVSLRKGKRMTMLMCGNKGNQPFDLTKAFEKYGTEELDQYIKNPKAFGNAHMWAFDNKTSTIEYPYSLIV